MIQWKVSTCHLEKDKILWSEETESGSPFVLYRSLSVSKVIHVRILGQKNYLNVSLKCGSCILWQLSVSCFRSDEKPCLFLAPYTILSLKNNRFCFCFLKDVWSFLGTSFILSFSHPISMYWMMVVVVVSYSVSIRGHLNMNEIFYFAVTENKHRILVIQ